MKTLPPFVTGKAMGVPSAPVDGLWYGAKELSEPVARGEVLGEIGDVFGTVLATIRSETEGSSCTG